MEEQKGDMFLRPLWDENNIWDEDDRDSDDEYYSEYEYYSEDDDDLFGFKQGSYR